MLGRKSSSQPPKILEVDANFQGNLVFKDAVNLRISGHFEGTLETKGELIIAETATVKADITGEKIKVSGHLTGNITAFSEIHVSARGKIVGDVDTPALTVERGGVLQGACTMLSLDHSQTMDRKLFLTPEEVARYLSVEKSLVDEWAENGKLPGSREGETWRFDKAQVDQWIANGRI